MNHFEIFGIAPSVDVDVKALEQRHRELSLEVHPDRLAGADAHTRRLAAEKSAALNDAIKVLRDPARRAFYLLKLNGVDLEAEHAAAKVKLPMEFLEEIIERREALEAAKAEKNLDKAHAMAGDIRVQRDEQLEEAQDALRVKDLEAATVALGRLRYYSRFLEEVDAFEEELLA